MTAAELTAVLQQVTTQMASDHAWFNTMTEDMNDHAARMDRLTLVTTTNTVEIQASKVESERAFKLIDSNDGTVKNVTSNHDTLLQQVDTALGTQVQAEVSRLEALLA